MASNYPTSLDTTATLPAAADVGETLATFPHSELHGNANDAIIAIQTELGVAPSGSYATVKNRLDSLEGSWTAVTLLNDWVTATGSEPLRYRKIGDQVTLYGSIMDGTAVNIGVLPSGFRPANRAVQTVGSLDDPGEDDPGFLMVGVNSDGTIVLGAMFYLTNTFASPASLPGGVHINMVFEAV